MKNYIKEKLLIIGIVVLGIIVTSGLTLFLIKEENMSYAASISDYYCLNSKYKAMEAKYEPGKYGCCPEGYYFYAADENCYNDDFKTATKTYAYKYSTCNKGYYASSQGKCGICPANNYCEGGKLKFNVSGENGKTKCPEGFTSEAGSDSLYDCKITCKAGTYYEKGKGCLSCKEGYYCRGVKNVSGNGLSTGLEPCDPGLTSSEGASSKSDCRCPAGTYYNTTEEKCVSYKENEYNPCKFDDVFFDLYKVCCQRGYEYDSSLKKCVSGSQKADAYQSSGCDSNSTFDKNSGTCKCKSGYIYHGPEESCVKNPADITPPTTPSTPSTPTTPSTPSTVSKYRLSYLQNASGVTVTGMPTSTEYAKDTEVTISSSEPKREHYKFLGWNTSMESEGTWYKAGDKIKITSNVTLYARWERLKYTLTYDGKESGVSNLPEKQTYDGGSIVKVSDIIPTKDDKKFESWNTQSDYKGQTYDDGDSFTIKGDTTLYAKWRDLKEYNVIYSLNGASGSIETQIKTEGKELTLTTEIPEREGYTF